MYKVSYYVGGGTMVGSKWFETFGEATEFAINQPFQSVIEIKLYPEMKKKEDRT